MRPFRADRHPPAADEEQPPVTVLKSGVVDGMAYSLYSDGSIEAQMPEGMMRFASIDELRTHLDQRIVKSGNTCNERGLKNKAPSFLSDFLVIRSYFGK